MHKPELVYTCPAGGTVHRYDLPGGQSTFERYLCCFLGSCKFTNGIEESKKYLDTCAGR
ncbi:hypothetical protein CMK18_22775 [Candidatus Poribacteria bacterium]|nr:hypothetical protein [Candidatus Poribacteria bacterium]